jgi:hypothetical protein
MIINAKIAIFNWINMDLFSTVDKLVRTCALCKLMTVKNNQNL